MHYLLLLPIVYLAAVLQTSLDDLLQVRGVTPDLFALVAVVSVLCTPGPRAFLLGGGIMLLGDLIAPGRIGIGAAWMLVLSYAVVRLREHIRLDFLAVRVAVVGVAVAFWVAGVGATGRLLGELPLGWTAIGFRALGVGVYTAGVALPVLMILGWLPEPAGTGQRQLAS